MSQDNGSNVNVAKEEVDIDNLEVDLLIIAKTPANLRQTSSLSGADVVGLPRS